MPFTSHHILPLLLFLLLSLPPTLHSLPFNLSTTLTSPSTHTTCLHSTCKTCDTCNRKKLAQELMHCTDAVHHLRLYFQGPPPPPANITRDCSFSTCYPFQRASHCSLLSTNPTASTAHQHLTKALAQQQRRYQSLKTRKQSLIHTLLISTGLQSYHDKLLRLDTLIRKRRHDAFQVRAYNAQLRQYLNSFPYRQLRHQVTRTRFQSRDFKSHFSFWLNQQRVLSQVVRLSPAAVRDARDKLKHAMRQYEADAELLRVLREASGTTDEQVKVVTEMKLQLQRQVEWVETINAQARAQLGFIESARREVFELLKGVLDKVRQGKAKVRCGAGGVSDVVTEALMEAQA